MELARTEITGRSSMDQKLQEEHSAIFANAKLNFDVRPLWDFTTAVIVLE
jgi:hypothetical protein